MIDLLFCLLVAVVFTVIFKIQNAFFPRDYFAISQILIGNKVTYRQVIARMVLILFYSSLLMLILEKHIVIFGVTLGAFLIVWPGFLHPTEMSWGYHSLNSKEKFLYYFGLLLFVEISCLLLYFSTHINFREMVIKIVDAWLFGVLLILLGLEEKTSNLLSKSINEKRGIINGNEYEEAG